MRKTAQGFTLLETLIASFLLFMLFAGVFLILQLILRTVGESRVRLVASSLAQEKLEIAKNLSYSDVGTVGGIPSGSLPQYELVNINGQDFSVTTNITFIDDEFDDVAPIDSIPTDYKRVRVAVDWEGAFTPKNPLVLLTDIAPYGLESGENAGTLSIEVFDAQGQPISNANVSIVADLTTPTVDLDTLTDSNGMVVLPGAPICVDCYEITVTKSGFSIDKTYSTADVTNPIKPHLSILDGQLTHSSFSIDQLSNLTVNATRSRQAGYAYFPGVQFTLRGAKTLGTDEFDEPVYKYESNHVTGGFGRVVVSNIEWDTYDLFFPVGASIDIAGTRPLVPFGLSPNSSGTINIVAEPNSAHSMLVAVADSSLSLLEGASISLIENGVPIATKSAGAAGRGDEGQAYFGGLSQSTYELLITLTDYINATGSTLVNGDMNELILLTEN